MNVHLPAPMRLSRSTLCTGVVQTAHDDILQRIVQIVLHGEFVSRIGLEQVCQRLRRRGLSPGIWVERYFWTPSE